MSRKFDAPHPIQSLSLDGESALTLREPVFAFLQLYKEAREKCAYLRGTTPT
jgi:hypothetical protein